MNNCTTNNTEIKQNAEVSANTPENTIHIVGIDHGYGKDVNAGFKAQIDDGSERFRKEKADIPAELSGEVRQERSYLRKEQRRELLYELQMDMKNYSYERYKQAEATVDKALGDDAITAEKHPEMIEQEQREAERRRAERQQKRRRNNMEL